MEKAKRYFIFLIGLFINSLLPFVLSLIFPLSLGESFVRAITNVRNADFGTTKVQFDVSMTVILVGFMARFFGRIGQHRKLHRTLSLQ